MRRHATVDAARAGDERARDGELERIGLFDLHAAGARPNTLLKRVEAKAMKKLRPLGRRYLNMSLNHFDLDCFGDQLLCPCGSYKNYKKCCGYPRN